MKARRFYTTTMFVLFGLCVVLPVFAEEGALLQGLDKVTARVSTFEAPQDKIVRFGTLEVVVRTCSKAPPEEPPESTARPGLAPVPESRPTPTSPPTRWAGSASNPSSPSGSRQRSAASQGVVAAR